MSEYLRIRDPDTGHHLTVTREQFEAFGGVILNRPALDSVGNPLPPKYNSKLGQRTPRRRT